MSYRRGRVGVVTRRQRPTSGYAGRSAKGTTRHRSRQDDLPSAPTTDINELCQTQPWDKLHDAYDSERAPARRLTEASFAAFRTIWTKR
jgi:hypothetical protein